MARGKNTTLAYWRQHFLAQAESGLNTAAYLRQEGIRSSQWYRWRKNLREAGEVYGATLLPVKVQPEASTVQDIQVHLPNGVAVTFSQLESPVQLVQALYRLETT